VRLERGGAEKTTCIGDGEHHHRNDLSGGDAGGTLRKRERMEREP